MLWLAAMALTPPAPPPPDCSAGVLGDYNCDGCVDLEDRTRRISCMWGDFLTEGCSIENQYRVRAPSARLDRASAAAALKESAARFSKAVDAAEAEAAAAAPAEAPAEAPAVELAGLKTVGFSSDMAACRV